MHVVSSTMVGTITAAHLHINIRLPARRCAPKCFRRHTLASSRLACSTLSFSSGLRSRNKAYSSVTGRAIRTYYSLELGRVAGESRLARTVSGHTLENPSTNEIHV